MPTVKIVSPHTTSVVISDLAKIAMRSYLSTHYLWSARIFTNLAQAIEDEHEALGKSPGFDEHHRAYTLGAITCSAAFLEAAINEVYQDVADGHLAYTLSLSEEDRIALRLIWKVTEEQERNLRVLDKYKLALEHLGRENFDEGRNPYQNAKLAIGLRNKLVHYKPETTSIVEQSKWERHLAAKLGRKYPKCRLVQGTDNPFFPDQCLGYGVCTWMLDAVTEFADEFFRRLGIKPNYQKYPFPLPAKLGSS